MERFSYKLSKGMTECPHEFSIEKTRNPKATNALIKEAVAWCAETLPEKRKIRFYYSGWTIWLVEENDAFQFRLRWC